MKRLLVLAALYVGLCAAGGALIVDRALQRPRIPITAVDRLRADDLARTLGARLESVSLAAQDGATLRGWLVTPDRPNRHSVLLVPGIVSNRAALLTSVRMFVEQGYRALAVDTRGQGESGGDFITFGVNEAVDLGRWIERLRDAPDTCVYEFGGSLGASLALQAANTPGVCAVVAQSGYASFREMAFDRIGQQLHTGAWAGRTLLRPGVELGFLSVRIRHGFDLSASSAMASVARPGAPILLIHGTDDDNVPVRHAQLIQAANPSRVSLWLVPGGTHALPGRTAPGYWARILGFLASHRRPM